MFKHGSIVGQFYCLVMENLGKIRYGPGFMAFGRNELSIQGVSVAKFILILLGVFTGLSVAQAEGLPDYDPGLARKLVKEEKALLLDVRTKAEYNKRHLPGAQLIEVSALGKKVEEVKKLVENDMGRPIVVYCVSGARSAQAKQLLVKAGFKKVTNLGGWTNWYKEK